MPLIPRWLSDPSAALDEFVARLQRWADIWQEPNGHLGKCKSCTIAGVSRNRAAKREAGYRRAAQRRAELLARKGTQA